MKARPILIVEDEHALGTALSFAVRRIGHLPTLVASAAAARTAAARQPFAAVVLDIGLPDASGLTVLESLHKENPALPVLIVTAHATLDHAIHAHKLGVTEFMRKPLDLKQFEQALEAMLAQSAPPPTPPAEPPALQAMTLIGAAPCMQEVFLGVARACVGSTPVLIWGPSGSGKSLAAKVIHAHSECGSTPLRWIDGSLAAPGPAWDEMFSDPSGAVAVKELASLPAERQAWLSAWVSDQAGRSPRLLATMTAEPAAAVREGLLRPDLYYAFSALEIPMPPLSRRSGDIAALVSFFLGLRAEAPAARLTPPALEALQAYDWPGNVRELRHVVDYAANVSLGGPVFLSHLPPHVAAAAGNPIRGLHGELDSALARWLEARLGPDGAEPPTYDQILESIESGLLRQLMDRFHQRPTHLASALRMNRATLRQKLRRAGLSKDGD